MDGLVSLLLRWWRWSGGMTDVKNAVGLLGLSLRTDNWTDG